MYWVDSFNKKFFKALLPHGHSLMTGTSNKMKKETIDEASAKPLGCLIWVDSELTPG